jgi:hypothetical protein
MAKDNINKNKNNTDKTQTGLTRDKNGRITGGIPPAGFNKHPENRGKGFWKREDTPRYKLEQMMKLDEDQLVRIYNNKKAPLFERKLAKCIKDGNWKEIESMINQVYGAVKQSVDLTSGGEPFKVVIEPELIKDKDNVA